MTFIAKLGLSSDGGSLLPVIMSVFSTTQKQHSSFSKPEQPFANSVFIVFRAIRIAHGGIVFVFSFLASQASIIDASGLTNE